MLKKNKILRLVAGILLSAFIFLFVHSELDLLKVHGDDCNGHDFCLIVDIAELAHHPNLNNTSKTFFVLFIAAIVQLAIVYNSPLITKPKDNHLKPLFSNLEKPFLRFCSLLI